MITVGQKSRVAEPFELLDAITEHDAMVAERHLLRSLLKRCDAVLRERDSIVEGLIQDIALAME